MAGPLYLWNAPDTKILKRVIAREKAGKEKRKILPNVPNSARSYVVILEDPIDPIELDGSDWVLSYVSTAAVYRRLSGTDPLKQGWSGDPDSTILTPPSLEAVLDEDDDQVYRRVFNLSQSTAPADVPLLATQDVYGDLYILPPTAIVPAYYFASSETVNDDYPTTPTVSANVWTHGFSSGGILSLQTVSGANRPVFLVGGLFRVSMNFLITLFPSFNEEASSGEPQFGRAFVDCSPAQGSGVSGPVTKGPYQHGFPVVRNILPTPSVCNYTYEYFAEVVPGNCIFSARCRVTGQSASGTPPDLTFSSDDWDSWTFMAHAMITPVSDSITASHTVP